jgi:hypothetical protein
MVVRWTFQDLTTLQTYTMAVNPREDNTPGFEKSFAIEQTTAPGGKTLVFEGTDRPRRGGFSGALYTESEYTTLWEWWDRRNQIRITDDLGRSFTVIFETYMPKRKRSYDHPWRHDYEITYIVLN